MTCATTHVVETVAMNVHPGIETDAVVLYRKSEDIVVKSYVDLHLGCPSVLDNVVERFFSALRLEIRSRVDGDGDWAWR